MATFGDSGTLGGNSRLPLPESFDGTMEKWEDWSWHVRSYVSMFKEHVLRVMDAAEEATSVITDDAVQTIEDNGVELTGLIAFSRQLHYLLSLITKNSARLVVRGNLGLNGFETWRLLSRRFALPSTANNISLLTKVLEFVFRTEHFEQDYTEWEQLKNRYERQTGTALPDSILVATLLNKTSGSLQQHLRLNVRTLDTYDTVRNVILDYYQSRHVVKSDTQTPMDIGAMWKKGKGKGRVGLYPLKGKGKGKGRVGLYPFGHKGKGRVGLYPLKGKGKMKGKGKTGMNYKGKGDKGKGDRQKCWNCGNFGHFSKDCKMMVNAVDYVTDDTQEEWTEEEWNDWLCSVTEEWYENQYYEDWTDWTDWTDWSDDWTGYWHEQNWPDTQTVGHPTGSNDANLVSQPATQNLASGAQPSAPTATVSAVNFDPESLQSTGSTLTNRSTVRRTSKLGTAGALLGTVAVLSMFGRSEGLSLDSQSSDASDVLDLFHETCLASLSLQEHWVLFDSGPAAHCCPANYASDYPLLPLGENPPKLRSVTGKPLTIYGRRLVRYNCDRVYLTVNYYVCDVPFCLVSVTRMVLQGFWTVLGKDCLMLLTPEGEKISITGHGTLLYLTPSLEPFSNVPPELTAHFEEHMRELSTELSHVTTEESTVVTQDDPLEKLESLIGT